MRATFNQFLQKFIQKELNKKFWILFDKNWWNNYKNSTTKNLRFKCKTCKKEILKSYQNIINGSGCPECAKKSRNKNRKLKYEEFIIRAKEKNKYFNQYILPNKEWFNKNYTSQNKTYLNIFCKNCNKYFKKSVNEFLKGSGCSCVGKKNKLTQNEVIQNLKEKFPEYNYSKVNYKNTTTNIEIICPIHGSFYKKYNDMIIQNQGCPKCSQEKQRSKGEEKIKEFLIKYNIKFKEQYNLFLENKKLKFDFYLIGYNIAIEYDGEYHFKKIPKRENQFKKTKQRDFLKNKLCFIYKINLIRIPYWEFKNLEEYLIKILKRERVLA